MRSLHFILWILALGLYGLTSCGISLPKSKCSEVKEDPEATEEEKKECEEKENSSSATPTPAPTPKNRPVDNAGIEAENAELAKETVTLDYNTDVAVSLPLSSTSLLLASSSDIATLDAKRSTYVALATAKLQATNNFYPGCDALLFTGVAQALGGLPVDVTRAKKGEEGQYVRRPPVNGEDVCYPAETKSTISRDMMTGLFLALYKSKDLASIEQFLNYARKARYIPGEAPDRVTLLSRVLITPTLLAMMYKIRRAAGGDPDPRENVDYAAGFIADRLPLDKRTVNTIKNSQFAKENDIGASGFGLHLVILRIIIHGSIYGGVSQSDYETLLYHGNRQPGNALVNAALACYSTGTVKQTATSRAITTLLSTSLFPTSTLPTRANFDTDYLFQREQYKEDGVTLSGDWIPSTHSDSASEVNPGIDWLAAHQMLSTCFL